MNRICLKLVLLGICLLSASFSMGAMPLPDGTVRITSRSVAPGIGLSWGDGVLNYKGQDYPFTFQAKGLFREVDPNSTATEISGEVFNLKRPQLFNGTYHKVKADNAAVGGGSRASMKNSNGVTVNLVSTVEGRKFNLDRDGISIKLGEAKK